jgi:uncharacterized MnhB-related membrane protein
VIQIDDVILLLATVLAVAAVFTRILRHAVVFLGIFSLLCSFLYLYFGAPDVAIAEAVIGSGLVMLLYLTALKRYRTYRICVTDESGSRIEDRGLIAATRRSPLIQEIEAFCISRELEPEVVFSPDDVESLKQRRRYDLIISNAEEGAVIYGQQDNYLVEELELLLILHSQDYSCRFERYGEDV